MSAPLAGKFQDHYALLGLDPKADLDKIQAAYAKVAEKYRPDNWETGDPEKFDAINLALEVLSDPALRKEFDKIKGIDQDDGLKFSGPAFFEALGHEVRLRVAMLCVLYDRRRLKPFTPALSMRQVENSLVATEEALNFALWYLKQRGYVGQDDKSSLLITCEGMDYLETNRPDPEMVMPLIRSDALIVPEEEPAAPEPEEPVAAEMIEDTVEELDQPDESVETFELPLKAQETVRNIMRRVRHG